MTSTFYLKNPKTDSKSLILFSCYFKYEGKKFVYSTGESISPTHWDSANHKPFLDKKRGCSNANEINAQLNRYAECFIATQTNSKIARSEFSSAILKKAFDEEFKKAPSGKNLFYDAYDEFVDQRTKSMHWSKSTIKRYKNIKNILQNFSASRKYNITFNSINDTFYAVFSDYCMNELMHINNTYSRNVGLLKSFLYWAVDNHYTYNRAFVKFKKVQRVLTNQIALKLSDLEHLMSLEFETKRLEKVRDVFVFACVTGLRFGEMKLVNRSNVNDININLKEEKESSKEIRTIPLMPLSRYILEKYEYRLPLIANQKHNEYIKEVFKVAGYTQEIEKVTTKGKEVIRKVMPFYERVSTHTARRTYITMMKSNGISDKLIATITGHRDMKTLNQYYQVDDESKVAAVEKTFKIEFSTLKKA